MPDYLSEIDTSRFGFKIARTENLHGDPRTIIDELKDQGVKLFIARVNTDDITTINTLENLGFEYKDTQLKYSLNLIGRTKQAVNKVQGFRIRTVADIDVDEIVSISEEAFYNHGHYFADQKLDRQKCLETYRDWARRCCLDKNFADIVFVAENDEEIMGFLSYKILNDGDSRFAKTGLGAMKIKYRGAGIYSEILDHGTNWGIDMKLNREDHLVLVTNIPINNLFLKKGFKLSGGFITFHYWLEPEKSVPQKHIELLWDSNFFGFKVARIIPENMTPAELGDELRVLKEHSFRFVYLFLDPLDSEFNSLAVDNGGTLIDGKITYSLKLAEDFSENGSDDIFEFQDQDEQMENRLISLSFQAGTFSRFRRDPKLNPDQFERLYSIWVKNSLNGIMADQVYVYKKDGEIKGFITLRTKTGFGEIVLIGVDQGERGSNIGTGLLNKAKSFFHGQGIFYIRVVTQKNNVPACKFYEKNGFTVEKIKNVYHFWL